MGFSVFADASILAGALAGSSCAGTEGRDAASTGAPFPGAVFPAALSALCCARLVPDAIRTIAAITQVRFMGPFLGPLIGPKSRQA
jgi:hypothetical protein